VRACRWIIGQAGKWSSTWSVGRPKNVVPPSQKPARRHRRALVRLIIAAVFGLDGIGAERHQAVKVSRLNGELDHHPPGRIPAHQIAIFQDRLEEPICLAHRLPALPLRHRDRKGNHRHGYLALWLCYGEHRSGWLTLR
jgi:hypothetical protein